MRFSVTYRLADADLDTAKKRALDIALEQTVEIPRDIVPPGYVEDEILGRLEQLVADDDGYRAKISYANADAGGDFLQLLNVIFGNTSIKTGIRVERVDLNDELTALFPGSRFGIKGLRQRLGVDKGPLLMSAVKPVGLSTTQLAEIARNFALGGMDMVKDDHGLVDQQTSPFTDRVKACVESIGEANAVTGGKSIFVANITGTAAGFMDRAMQAKELGAGGVMVAPALQGYAAVQELAAHCGFGLPIVSHPAFSGANVIAQQNGFSHRFYYGQLQRMMGVDVVVYPNFGGRFGFSVKECREIVQGCSTAFGSYAPALPAPGGGMSIDKAPELAQIYGDDVVFLIGGALLRENSGIVAACKRLGEAVGRNG